MNKQTVHTWVLGFMIGVLVGTIGISLCFSKIQRETAITRKELGYAN